MPHDIAYECHSCRLPFHYRAESTSKETGYEDVALNCPNCGAALILKIPARFAKEGELFRSSPPEDE